MNTKVMMGGSSVVLLLVLAYVFWPWSGNSRDLPDRVQVHGTVIYNGQAPVGAYVVLNPLPLDKADWKTVIPKGRVGADGKYQVQSFEKNDGAPAGEYAVTIVWTGYADPGIKPGEDKFGGMFNDLQQPMHTLTIPKDADGSKPIVLPKFELDGPTIAIESEEVDPRGR